MNSYYKGLLDSNYNFEKSYFLRSVSENDWKEIKEALTSYFESGSSDVIEVKKSLSKIHNLRKGANNVEKLRELTDEVALEFSTKETFFKTYKALNDLITNEYMMAKPSVLECHFFPDEAKEDSVINMIRTCKFKIDIAIFSLTNNKIFAAILELWECGIDIRVITDDECCKQLGSDIFKLAADGIPIKTDDSERYHMHHKFAVIDEALLITGSFNWTTQAVKNNQENVIFFENKEVAMEYTKEFDKLWKNFKSISKEDAQKEVKKERENKRKNYK